MELLELYLLGGSDDNSIRSEVKAELNKTTVDGQRNEVTLALGGGGRGGKMGRERGEEERGVMWDWEIRAQWAQTA